MKKIGLVMTLLVGLMGLFSFTASANADRLSADRPEKGDLTIHKHYLPEGVGTGADGTGSTTDEVPDQAIALSGVHFDLYQVGTLKEVSTDSGKTWKKASQPDVIPGGSDVQYSYQVTGSKDNWTVTAKKGVKQYRYQLLEVSHHAAGGQTSTQDGTLKFSDLPAGEYLIVESLAKSKPQTLAKAGEPAKAVELDFGLAPFVIGVPLKIADKWNSDVHVYPKNKSNEVMKEYDTKTPAIGEAVDYQISTGVPESIGGYQRFEIWDELHEAHTLVEDSIKVYQAKLTEQTAIKKIELEKDAAGKTIEIPQTLANQSLWEVIRDGQKFTVQFTPAGRNYLGEQKITRIALAFKALINEKAQITTSDPMGNIIPNQGQVVFTNQHGEDSERPTNETLIPLIEVEVHKQNQQKEPLAAQFALTTSKANAQANKFIQVKYATNAGKIDRSQVTQLVTPEQSTYAGAVADSAYEDYQVTTDSKTGLARFIGLPMTGKNYWAKELQAPNGYRPLAEPQEVKAGSVPTNWTKETLAKYTDQSITIINVPLASRDDEEEEPKKDDGNPSLPHTNGDSTGGTPQSGLIKTDGIPNWITSFVHRLLPTTKSDAAEIVSNPKEVAARWLPKTGSAPSFVLTIIGIILAGLIIIYSLNRKARLKRQQQSSDK